MAGGRRGYDHADFIPFYRRLVDGGPVLKLSAFYRLGSPGNALVLEMTLPPDRVRMARAIIENELLKTSDPLDFFADSNMPERVAGIVEAKFLLQFW